MPALRRWLRTERARIIADTLPKHRAKFGCECPTFKAAKAHAKRRRRR